MSPGISNPRVWAEKTYWGGEQKQFSRRQACVHMIFINIFTLLDRLSVFLR